MEQEKSIAIRKMRAVVFIIKAVECMAQFSKAFLSESMFHAHEIGSRGRFNVVNTERYSKNLGSEGTDN
jgi:hypothetical protein